MRSPEPTIFFEDIEVGSVVQSGWYEVPRDEVIEFAARWDPYPHHLDDDAADLFSLRRSFTPRNVLEACVDPRDARCIGVAGPWIGSERGHALAKRPACSVREDGTPSHVEGVARARVFERQAPFLLAIPIDGVKTWPIERASTC